MSIALRDTPSLWAVGARYW